MERATKQLSFWLEKVQNFPLFVETEFIESPLKWPACNVLPHVESLTDVVLNCKKSLASNEMELKAALDATSVLSSPSDSYAEVLEQYTWAKSGIRPDRPPPGSVQVHVSRRTEPMFGLEGHATLGAHLIHLDLRDPVGLIWLSVEECLVALSNFSHLEYCALRIGESTDEVPEQLILMYMHTLSLFWNDGVEVAALLDSITAPCLRELELKGALRSREFFPGNRWNHLQEFLRRSSPELYALTLAKTDCTTIDFMGCLALCDGLQRLSLEQCQVDEELMDSLHQGNNLIAEQAVRTFMGLEYLALISCNMYGLNDFLRDSLDTHVWLGINLHQLYIVNCGYISDDVLAAMREIPLEEFGTDPDLLEEMLS